VLTFGVTVNLFTGARLLLFFSPNAIFGSFSSVILFFISDFGLTSAFLLPLSAESYETFIGLGVKGLACFYAGRFCVESVRDIALFSSILLALILLSFSGSLCRCAITARKIS